jgi:D-alanyl-D-alanine carboxypeptidase (penicillin-binding protein 5/6)
MTGDSRKTLLLSRRGALVGVLAVVLVVAAPPAGAMETLARHALLMDTTTGAALFEKDADTPMAPASMSKMMTVYMIFERLRDGRLSLDDTFPVSENAWRKGGAKSGGSTMFLEPGTRVRVEDLLRGIIVQSGNDACIVAAEGLSVNEDAFANEMTFKAREIGLEDTVFKNATGWPDPEHVTTARDLSILAARTIEDFPEYYHYYADKNFTYNGIRQGNRNPLLYKDIGADGLKTGHTADSGYGLAVSVVRGDRRLIVVVNGLPSVKARSRESERLIEWGIREFKNYALFKRGETVTDVPIWLGESEVVGAYVEDDIVITLAKDARRDMKVSVNYVGPVAAPVAAGDVIATLSVTAPRMEPIERPLRAMAPVPRLGVFRRLGAALKSIMWGVSG